MNTTQRKITLDAKRKRPGDPWPRGEGHVILGIPGSPRDQKGYHEPGGSFSPSPGSFGISIWLISSGGKRIISSDEIPLESIRQHFEWHDPAIPPSLITETADYTCRWSLRRDNVWEMEFLQNPAIAGRPVFWVRSVGPAGGPIESLSWDGRQLILNHRWIVELSASDVTVRIGDENQADWAASTEMREFWESDSGWGCARIEFADSPVVRLRIRDTAPWFEGPLSFSQVRSGLELELPDEAFRASVDAQAAHLLMGFIGRQTCPGEPTNYPLAWERDGAYSVLAMARAGQIETAKELAVYFAENDFFGGFGAEGDAPGSSINALVSVALIANDPGFTTWIWPHVKRKTGLIKQMLLTREPIRKNWLGPIVPEHLTKDCIPIICQAAENGLIVGSMDLHHPVLYINAFSRRGLLLAAKLAESLGEPVEAEELRALGGRIQAAWMANFGNEAYENERTYMSALWPTWMVGPGYKPFQDGLENRWNQLHMQGEYPERPLWTYFTAAEAHQWLFLDQPDHVWKTLRFFWSNQCSPGLYTYWEGAREENSFGLWENIRGWVCPKFVTPHYWTAAEMILLQLDMLAYVSDAGGEQTLVIGAGVPAEWLQSPMQVKGLRTEAGLVDWSYRGGKIAVTVHGPKPCSVRAGFHFGDRIPIQVTYQ